MNDGASKTTFFVDRVAALVVQARDGDRASFVALVQFTQQPLFRRAYIQMGDRAAAEDVIQEVMLQAWRSLQHLRDPQAAWAWFCQMTFNIARDHRRKRKRTKEKEQLMSSPETQAWIESWFHDSDLTPEKQMISAELSALVKQAVEQLDEKYREVIRLREFGQFSYQEIAGTLGCSLSAVESRLHRARNQLTHHLKRLFQKSLDKEGGSS